MSMFFQVKTQGQIIYIDIIGQWSECEALGFEQTMHSTIPSLNGGKFAHLISFEKWELSTPEVEPIIKRTLAWCVKQGLSISAEVFTPDALKEYLLDKSVEDTKGELIIRRFNNKKVAATWLAEMGYQKVAPLVPVTPSSSQ